MTHSFLLCYIKTIKNYTNLLILCYNEVEIMIWRD